jgi:hypothetical protein
MPAHRVSRAGREIVAMIGRLEGVESAAAAAVQRLDSASCRQCGRDQGGDFSIPDEAG